MRLIRPAILIILLFMLIFPAYAQSDDLNDFPHGESSPHHVEGSWEEALARIGVARINGAIELDLSHLWLESLPPELYELTQLEILILDYNRIHEWSEEIGNLVNLQEVSIVSNSEASINAIPISFYMLPNIERLNIGYNRLTEIPVQISRFRNLHELNIDENPISTLPSEFSQLSNLEIITFRNRSAIPDVVFQLPNLRVLNMNVGWFDAPNSTELSPEIARLTQLEELHLRKWGITSLPAEIGQLTNLRILNLNGNNLTELPTEIGNLVNLQELHLNGNYLTTLPDSIGNLTQLEWLDLAFNDLVVLPSTIGDLTQLQELDLAINLLTVIPSEIGQLENLEILYLIGNELTELPREIGDLASLTHLHLRGNQLTALPSTIGNLSNLEVLSLGARSHNPGGNGNNVTALPSSIGNLSNLRYLYLDYVPIQTFPSSISRLDDLVISLYDSHLERLPLSFADMDNVHISLWMSDDVVVQFPPQEIWWYGGDTSDIQSYLWWHRFWWWRALPVGVVVGLYAIYRLIGWLWMRRQGAWVGKKKKKRAESSPND